MFGDSSTLFNPNRTGDIEALSIVRYKKLTAVLFQVHRYIYIYFLGTGHNESKLFLFVRYLWVGTGDREICFASSFDKNRLMGQGDRQEPFAGRLRWEHLVIRL